MSTKTPVADLVRDNPSQFKPCSDYGNECDHNLCRAMEGARLTDPARCPVPPVDASAPAEVARATWRKEPPDCGGWWGWRDGDAGDADSVGFLADLDNGSQPGPLIVTMESFPSVELPEFLAKYPDSHWFKVAMPVDDTAARVTPAVEAIGTFTAPGRVVSGGIDPVTQCRRVVVEIDKGALVPSMEPGERVTVRKG